MIIPDSPEFERLRDVQKYLSELDYREAGNKVKEHYTVVPDTPSLQVAKYAQHLQDEVRGHSVAIHIIFTFYYPDRKHTKPMLKIRCRMSSQYQLMAIWSLSNNGTLLDLQVIKHIKKKVKNHYINNLVLIIHSSR